MPRELRLIEFSRRHSSSWGSSTDLSNLELGLNTSSYVKLRQASTCRSSTAFYLSVIWTSSPTALHLSVIYNSLPFISLQPSKTPPRGSSTTSQLQSSLLSGKVYDDEKQQREDIQHPVGNILQFLLKISNKMEKPISKAFVNCLLE